MKTDFTYSGTVQPGRGRGSALGFPTANLSCRIPDNTLAEGVYTALTRRGNDTFPSLAFFGAARTFGEEEKRLEVHILDFQEQLYGEILTVTLLEKMRGNIRFGTEKELVAQMRQDAKEARSFFSTIACSPAS